jgi:hypothetical protein
MIGDFAFEASVFAQLCLSLSGDLITFIGPVPFEVDASCESASSFDPEGTISINALPR